MHELSIVQSLIELCEENARANNSNSISKVAIKVGKLSNIEPELLKTAFETFKLETMCKNASLTIDIADVKIECRECSKISTLDKNEFLCPFCKSDNFTIIDGEDMYLMSLELE